MTNIFLQLPFFRLIFGSSWLSSGILLTLIILSVLSIGIGVYSIVLLRFHLHQTLRMTRMMQATDQKALPVSFRSSLAARILEVMSRVRCMVPGGVRERVAIEIEYVLAEQERYLPFLSSTATLSPLLGLLGTIGGLVDAFTHIGVAQQVSIAVIAPGIADALITTLAGLLVAIPAQAFYCYAAHKVRQLEHALFFISDRLHDRMHVRKERTS